MERSPEAIALVFEESTLSYAELNAQANRLAHFLIGEGIGPEDLVALALPRSIEMVVVSAGHPQSRGGLSAPGSGVPCGEAELHAPGRSAGLCLDQRPDRCAAARECRSAPA